MAAIFLVLLLTASAAGAAECPNEALRTGPSAGLPACRAYELVSPPEAAGRSMLPINTWGVPSESPEMFPTQYVSPDGESVAFMAYMNALPKLPGATGIADLYAAHRGPDGWQTRVRLSPGGPPSVKLSGVSPDHSYASSSTPFTGTIAPRIVGRDGTYELAGLGSLGVEPYSQVRFITSEGEHIIFTTGHAFDQAVSCQYAGVAKCNVNQLEADAPPTGTGAIYDRSAGGPTHVVSMLPGNNPLKAGEEAYYMGTSKDGSAVAFEVRKNGDATGPLYVRVDNGEIGEEATQKVAESGTTFAGVSDQGRFVFYVLGGEKGVIHRYNTATQVDDAINPGHPGEIVNVSGDGSRVYFICEEAISGEGVGGEPNLFVWSEGSVRYVTTVVASDLVRTSPNPESGIDYPALTRWTSLVASPRPRGAFNGIAPGPGADSSRTTPDGTVLVFESRARLTAYDNGGHTEIYRWDDKASSMICVSCNFGHAAERDARLENVRILLPSAVVHNVSDDGSRVFFETEEPLVEGDVDGVNDIYEWRGGGGVTPSVDLISSGRTIDHPRGGPAFEYLSKIKPSPNTMLSVTPSGSDVVFFSTDELTFDAPEGGAVSIYDARVGGGYQPPPAPVVCLEEGCKPPARGGPPSVGTGLPSESLRGGGNLAPRERRRHRKHRHCKGKKTAKCGRKGASRRSSRAARASMATLSRQPTGEVPASGGGQPESDDASPQALATSTGSSIPVVAAVETEPEYGLKTVDADLSTAAAGEHADFTTDIVFNHHLDGKLKVSNESTEELNVSLPPGLLGNPNAVRRCKTLELISENCPIDSQVGLTTVLLNNFGGFREPIYNMQLPNPDEEVARFGFIAAMFPVYLDIKVRTASDYGVTATVYGPSGFTGLITAKTVFWGNPSDPLHDEERLPQGLETCEPFCGSHEVPRTRLAFMANPSACQTGEVAFSAKSYQLPGRVFSKSAPLPEIVDCQGLPFAPRLEARPTTDVAGAPTGLKTSLEIPQTSDASEPATATMREARVTLPEGMAINPGAADGLAACSDEQVHFHQEVDAECPDASKLGVATILSPALARPLEGALFQRASGGKGNQFRLWLVADQMGMHVKIPGKVEPNADTGQLIAVFSDLPQVPLEQIDFDIWGGARAPLKNPDTCGSFETTSVITPWSADPAARPSDRFRIDRAPGGGSCPESAGSEPNSPSFKAGTALPISREFSPMSLKLSREDGSQNFGALDVTLPPGLVGRLAGLSECSEAALESAAGKSGRDEQANPSCPSESLVGNVWVGAGAGPSPYWAQGKAYLAGPYKGAPLSVAVITPAVAGPFDLGTVVVRSMLELDPVTAQVKLKTDPIPSVVEGVPLNVRTIDAEVDRDRFTLNGTSCEPLAFSGSLLSTLGNAAPLSAPFQVGECGRLRFRPRLSVDLKGDPQRSGFPALRTVYRARAGEANLKDLVLRFPHSEFIEQGHIRTICTRVRWAAGAGGGTACPKGSIYGSVRVFTPLLDKPLEGPVYLRSSDHSLPDVIMALRGQVNAEVAVRIDSARGGLRATIENAPDVPISKAILRMQGGQKGLLVNSRNTCAKVYKTSAQFGAHNGRTAALRPSLINSRCGKGHRRGSSRGGR